MTVKWELLEREREKLSGDLGLLQEICAKLERCSIRVVDEELRELAASLEQSIESLTLFRNVQRSAESVTRLHARERCPSCGMLAAVFCDCARCGEHRCCDNCMNAAGGVPLCWVCQGGGGSL